jgi:hypothetical protein
MSMMSDRRRTMDDDELDRRLTRADVARNLTVPGVTLDELALAAREAGRSSRRRRLGLAAVLGALALGGGLAAPAAADGIREFLAISEWQPGLDPDLDEDCPPASCQFAPGSDMVDLSAPDLRQYLETIYPEWLPLAPGETRTAILDGMAAQAASDPEAGLTQEIGLRATMERIAYCGWVDLWLTTSDDAAQVQAADVMLQATTWPATVETDGGGVVAFLEVFAAGAAAGDREAVEAASWQLDCSTAGPYPADWFEQNTPTW